MNLNIFIIDLFCILSVDKIGVFAMVNIHRRLLCRCCQLFLISSFKEYADQILFFVNNDCNFLSIKAKKVLA